MEQFEDKNNYMEQFDHDEVPSQSFDVTKAFTTDKLFHSRNELIEWCRLIGKNNNTVVVITNGLKKCSVHWSLEENKGTQIEFGKGSCVVLGCERSRNYKPHTSDDYRLNTEKKRKRNRGTKKCKCPFHLRGTCLENFQWSLRVVCGTHNHTRPETLTGRPYPGRLKPSERQMLEEMSSYGCKPTQILSHIKKIDAANCSTLQTLYNQKARLKRIEQERKSSSELVATPEDGVSASNVVEEEENIEDQLVLQRSALKVPTLVGEGSFKGTSSRVTWAEEASPQGNISLRRGDQNGQGDQLKGSGNPPLATLESLGGVPKNVVDAYVPSVDAGFPFIITPPPKEAGPGDWEQDRVAVVSGSRDGPRFEYPSTMSVVMALTGPLKDHQLVGDFPVAPDFVGMYTRVWRSRGHLATCEMIKRSLGSLVEMTAELLKIIAEMDVMSLADVTARHLSEWGTTLNDAESMKFNVAWLREHFENLSSTLTEAWSLKERRRQHEVPLDKISDMDRLVEEINRTRQVLTDLEAQKKALNEEIAPFQALLAGSELENERLETLMKKSALDGCL